MKKTVLLLIALISINSTAQILNVESLRKVTDTSGWSGSASFDFALKRNVNDFITFGSNIHIQYKMDKHLVLFKNDVQFEKIEGSRLENKGISHLRYNYRFHKRIAWEAFVQGQYNRVSLIEFRGIAGIGPRFKLINSEKYKFYLGTLVMYEYEELLDNITPTQETVRGSTYLSFSMYPKDNVTFTSTTYFQPRLSNVSDYRISAESILAVSLFQNFGIRIRHFFTFDAFPAIGIPNSQYEFTTGFVYTFD